MALLKKANTWYAYFRDLDGRQVLRTLHTGDRDIAIVRERAMKDMIREVKFRAAIQRMRPDEPQITTAFPKKQAPSPGEHQRGGIALNKMWDLALTRRELSATHQKHWKSFISRIGKKYADEITPQVALAYLEKHYNKGNGKTFNNVKSNLNTVFRMCLVEARLSESPFAPIANRRVTDVEHHRNLTEEEIDRIMAAPSIPEYAKIMTMLSRWTTLRLESCARVTPSMFDFETLVFLIDPGKNKRFKEWVCVPIFPELEKYIKPILAQCENSEKPIVQNFGYPKKNDYFSEDYRKWLKELGVLDTPTGKASFHSLRGSAITWLKENGVDREARRSITGHDSQDTEDIYARDIKTISRIAKAFKSK
jgi:integrase